MYPITRYCHPSQPWLPAVLRLRAEFGDQDQTEPFVGFVTRRLEDPTMLLLLAWAGEAAVGYGLAFDVAEHPYMPEWTRAGYIAQFLVSAPYRRQGVGQQLMDQINAWFQERDLHKVLLNVTLGNETGLQFWKRQGFQPYATRLRRVAGS